jgi:hypothetical protein
MRNGVTEASGQVITTVVLPSSHQGKTKAGLYAASAGAIAHGKLATVGLGDLAAECQTDAGATRLGSEEGHEEVRRVGDAGAFVAYPQRERVAVAAPPNVYASAGVE